MTKRRSVKAIKSEIMRKLDSRIDRLGPAVENEWRKEARRRLRKNVGRYLNAIINESDGDKIRITLRGKRAMVLEYGKEPFDMKDHLIGPKGLARNAKQSASGITAVIPFTTSKSSLARDLGSGIRKYVSAMPVARIEKTSGTFTSNKLQGADLLSVALSGKVKRAQKRTLDKIRSQHKGLVLSQDAKGKQHLVKFRTASRKSGPWLHPGVPAKRIARLVMRRIPHIIDRVMNGRNV